MNSGHGELLGMRVYLSNGEEAGCLNHLDFPDIPEGNSTTAVLEPPPNHKIIGFFGKSDTVGFGQAHEFGIIIAPRDIVLPPQLYEMKELQNTDGGSVLKAVICDRIGE